MARARLFPYSLGVHCRDGLSAGGKWIRTTGSASRAFLRVRRCRRDEPPGPRLQGPKVCRLFAGGSRIRTAGLAEGTGRPRGLGCRSRRDFRWRGTERMRHERPLKTWPSHAVPTVRIRLPPAKSRANFRFLSGGVPSEKGATNRLTAPAYWKFESISLQQTVLQNRLL